MSIPVREVTDEQANSLNGQEYAPGKPWNVKEIADGRKFVSNEEIEAYFTHDNEKEHLWLLKCPIIDHDPILYDDDFNRIN